MKTFFCCREIVLPVSAFDTKSKLITSLRERLSSESYFALSSEATAKEIGDLYQFLKNGYEMGPRRTCYLTGHVGYQGDGYWYISDQVNPFKILCKIKVVFKASAPAKLTGILKNHVKIFFLLK